MLKLNSPVQRPQTYYERIFHWKTFLAHINVFCLCIFRAHDMTTTSEFIRETMLSGDYIAKLNSKIKYLMTKIEKIFKVKEIA